MKVNPLHLDTRDDFSLSNGPSRTNGTAQGVAQMKIAHSAKSISSAPSSARGQANGVRRG